MVNQFAPRLQQQVEAERRRRAQQLADQIAPGSTVQDVDAFEQFIATRATQQAQLQATQGLTPDQENVKLLQMASEMGVRSFPGIGGAQNVIEANDIIRRAIATQQRLQQYPLALERREAATSTPLRTALTGLQVFSATTDPIGELLGQSGAQIGGEHFGTPGAIVGGLVAGALAPSPRLRPPLNAPLRPGPGLFPGVEGAIKTGRGVDNAARQVIRGLESQAIPIEQVPRALPVRPLGESLPPYRQIEPGVSSRELIERAASEVQTPETIDITRLPRRGREQILRRIDLATRTGDQQVTDRGLRPIGVLNVDEARSMSELVEALPDEYFENTSLSIRSTPRDIDFEAGTVPNAGGAYDPTRGLIELFHHVIREGNSPYVDDVFIHEVAHNLNRFVPEKDIKPLRNLYQQQKRAFEAGRFTPQRLGADATNLKYRFSSFDEWFAESFTDRALRDLFPEEFRRSAEGVFTRIRNVARGIYNWLLRKNRPDAAERVYRSLIAGENRKQLRGGTFGLSIDDAAGPEDVDPFDTAKFPLPEPGAQPLNRPRKTDLTPQAATGITQDAQFRSEVGSNPRATIEQGLADPASVPTEKLRIAAVEVASPDGGPPPRIPDVPPTRPVEPSDFLDRAIESRRQGTGWKWNSLERTDQALLRLHDAALNVETRRARDVVTQGNDRLAAFNWGRKIRGTRAPQSEDDIFAADELYRALHGEIEPPAGMREVYDDLRAQMDFESAQRIDFDPEMATVEDYFYRGWKPPENVRVSGRGQLVFTPGFKKPRADATYSEMRAAGFEPLFWNPYEQWNVARMQGVRYRQQMELVEALKNSGDDVILPHMGGTVPEGWRVPKIGPAFEGKPIMIKDELTGEVTPGAVRQWIVPDRIANALESAYGKKPNLGTVSIGNRDVQIQKLIDWAVFTPKRAKLLGSVFQQIDFATRAGIGTAANMVDHILRGRPDLAIRDGLKYPPAVFDMLRANFSPSRRTALRRTLDSTEPIIPNRPGVTMRSLMEQGLSVRDASLIPQDVDRIVREAANGAGVLGHRHVTEGLASLEKAMRDGLFDGVYPAAIVYDAQNVTGPMMHRLYGKNLTDAQLSARIASVLNTKYSTIPETQSVVQNRFLRETMRRFFFSVNEQEGILRQAAGPFRGADKAYWTRHWIGAAVFFLAVANTIHYASTGEPLPKDRYIPVSKRGYNTRFASPDLPFNVGRSGLPATLDIVGQMDTAFRVLDPKGYIESRFSVPVSAVATQWSGENYFGDRVDELGPGGVVSRTVALATDLFGPIGAAPLAGSALREVAPSTARAVPAGESRLSLGGVAIQGAGLNLRSYNFDELQKLKESNPQMAPQVDRELTMRKIDDAVRHVKDPTHILGTLNNLRARLKDAERLGYTSAVLILEREVKRREERQRRETQERVRSSGGNVIVVPTR